MKKLMMLGAILLVAGLVQAGSVPELVNYQGRLTDDDGDALATGDYALKFEVHTSPTADTRVWGPLCFDLDTTGTPTDGHKFKVPVVQGYFNVVLDMDTGYSDCKTTIYEDSPAPVTDAFLDESRYVEVAVGTWNGVDYDWAPILPRQQVLAAPYAVSADRSREIVSGVGETTRIACQIDPVTTVDVVTVDGDPAAVDVAGDLDVSQSLECNDLTVLGSITGGSLGLTGDLTVGGTMTDSSGNKPIFFSYFRPFTNGTWNTKILADEYNIAIVGVDSGAYDLDENATYEHFVVQPIKARDSTDPTGPEYWFVRARFEGQGNWPNPSFYVMAVSKELSEWRCMDGAAYCFEEGTGDHIPECATCVHGPANGPNCSTCDSYLP
jgi:hypothetical protein